MVVYVDRACGLDAGRVSPVGCGWSRLHASSSPPVLGVEVHVGPREYAGATRLLADETSPSRPYRPLLVACETPLVEQSLCRAVGADDGRKVDCLSAFALFWP